MKRKVMILGAGAHQIRAIRKAVELGYYVITVDYLPGNIGHRYSHACENVSTVDVEGVLQVAMRWKIDGICTFSSDVSISAVGHVCDKMGLPGISRNVAETLSDKGKFRSFMAGSGMRTPRFFCGGTDSEIYEALRQLSFPVVVKPVDSSGSRGITKLVSDDRDTSWAAFGKAKAFSRSGRVCIEECLDGTEVGGDGILFDGRFAFIAITQKYLDHCIVTGHRLPTSLSKSDQLCVINALEDCCRRLGYRNGPLNFDVMVNHGQAAIIEVSGRTGGNGIPSVIDRATNVDVEAAVLKSAMGESVPVEQTDQMLRGCGSVVFGSEKPGILERICTFESLRRHVPQVLEWNLSLQEGQRVEAFEHNGCMIGYVVFDCADAAEYAMLSRRILETLNISVRER